MKIIIIQPFGDAHGRVWIKGRRYTVDDETGAGFIQAGFARAAYTDVVKDLIEAGTAGLVVSDDTDPHLITEAKAAGLKVTKPRGGKKAKADDEGADGAE